MFGNKKNSSPITPERFDTILGPSSDIRGDVTTSDSIRIDGKLVGNVSGTEGSTCTVVIGEKGSVKGNIAAHRVVVAGRLQGHINATLDVELQSHCSVEGDIECTSVAIAYGARVLGKVATTDRREVHPAVPGVAAPAALGGTKVDLIS